MDEGAGHSFAYGVTAMASKSYVASYVKGAFHFTAEAADGFVPPAKDAAIFLDTEDYVGQVTPSALALTSSTLDVVLHTVIERSPSPQTGSRGISRTWPGS